MKLKIYTDGASRGNPGPAGFGFVIYDEDDNVVEKCSAGVGINTNNFAEYKGIVEGVRHAQRLNPSKVICYTDSQLAVRQINGQYKVKNKNLKLLLDELIELIRGMDIQFVHVGREHNKIADALAREGAETVSSLASVE